MKQMNLHLRGLVIGLSVFFSSYIVAQDKGPYQISLDTIKSLVEESPEVIGLLNEWVLNPDSTIMEDEYFLLYYGSAFVDSYNPYGESIISTAVNPLFDEKKYDEVIEISTGSIKQNPGYLKPYYNMAVAYDLKGDSTLAKYYYEQYINLLSIPFYSGTGQSEETAYFVRSVDDEYNIVRENGLFVVSQSLVYGKDGMPYDILTVQEEGAEESETIDLYFNIYLPFKIGMNNVLGDKEKKKKKKKKKKKEKKKKRKKKEKKD